ncbi:MAG: patatin-like phospholipase family protein [Euryarchaeota archaeon]|nr:patatin-like phospholipase family protein [Euryarchaeota archaeon]MCG2727832.1 patatin-like phospholipase family protein [Candidatus Methanoperedenaceae archaeon]
MQKECSIRKVGIACQGGGTHTAFTAGVLKKILKESPNLKKKGYQIIDFSGSSGGAVCALLAWYGLLQNDEKKSIELLDSFWEEMMAKTPWDAGLNYFVTTLTRMRSSGFPIPEISPYHYPPYGQDRLKQILERLVDFNKIQELLKKPSSPSLFVGSVEVCTGNFRIFKNADITSQVILASAAVPLLFPAVKIGDRSYWDGLLSHNPPIECFVHDLDPDECKTDEIWIIQINPQRRSEEPKTVEDILDRRNELAGNLSLNQEISSIEAFNRWLKEGHFSTDRYKYVEIKKIELDLELDYSSKLDRSPSFIRDLMNYGEEKAGIFLKQLTM